MTPSPNPAKQFIQNLIATGLDLQWRAVKVQWEPALTQSLGQAADDCLTLLRQELASQAADPGADPDWPALTARLTRGWARVVSTRGQAARALLLALAKEVVAETGQILTLHGLAGEPPALHAVGQDPRQALETLAGGPALEQAVAKSFREFGGLLTAQLRQAAAGGRLELTELYPRCQPIVRRWRARLETIARTIAHEVFNRDRLAVSQRLA